MATLLPFLLFLSIFSDSATAHLQSKEESFISVVVSEKGLDFGKDLLIEKGRKTLIRHRLPDIEKSVKIPVVGTVSMTATNITLLSINVSSSTVQPGESGILIVASGATANLSMNWRYSYRTWLIPIEISDEGSAFVRVEGLEVGLTVGMENQNGTLELNVIECGCYVKDMVITLDGGASWFYQGFVNAFEDRIRSAVESAITKNIIEGTMKLDSLLQTLPKKIDVDDVGVLNVTFVNDPVFGNSSVEFDINGLVIASDEVSMRSYLHENAWISTSCGWILKMLWISLDETVFNSASVVYFQAGLMHWIVDKVPDQSLLNTGSWKFLIPQLYKKYPNDDMILNISVTSPPLIRITPENIGAIISSDMTVHVLDACESIPVACISVVVSVSGVVEISGNNLGGRVELDDFTLKLKWSKVGNFHMHLIQGVMRAFLNIVFVPYVNMHLKQGFPLPIIHGFTLQNADILTFSSRMVICSDVAYTSLSGVV
ncbi:putative BPI/LBP family protein At1g04970 isoform X1 [Elaeis guineensis]|uniref:BPI/LBP family protein At1g04970 n=1 Tax=Elaeis guineensis var. tenera TaxID=51953 RepID=A0A6I9RKX9_ELAGV|nr:putative BPI/LBP family protein At1g04970 [Elaeis guineensis]